MDISIKSRSFDGGDISWLGSSHGTDAARSITLDVAKFTKATHYPDGVLKSGLPLTKGTSGKYEPFTGDDGSKLAGFLLTPVDVAATATAVAGALLDHGRVKTAKLPATISAAAQASAPSRIIFA